MLGGQGFWRECCRGFPNAFQNEFRNGCWPASNAQLPVVLLEAAPGAGDDSGLALGAYEQILERQILVDRWFPGQTEHPFADDVLLDLVGSAGNATGERG